MPLVVLRGGSRDGESTELDEHVDRLLAASHAPGLIDVYEATDELVHLRGNDDAAIAFIFAGQEPIGDLDPEALHVR